MSDLNLGSDDAVSDEGDYSFFRHNMVNRFKVGRYEFVDHLLTVKNDDVDNFLRVVDGLEPIDRNAITQVLNIRNERPLSELKTSRRVDGIADTARLKDPTDPKPAGQESDATPRPTSGQSALLAQLGKNAGNGPTT